MHRFANPARFVRLARPLTAWFGWIGVGLVALALTGGLMLTPPDYLQGDTVRIMYIHIPSAWLGMAGWGGIAAASFAQLVWRHPLAHVAARGCALPGAVYAAVCLITGSIWGRPTWGTWWEWDGRLTSMLILFFLYLAYLALAQAAGREEGGQRIAAASFAQLVWRHPLAHVAARACAVPGAVYAAICLITGSIWGRPTWGTWWEWDGRLTSMLVLFFLYLAYIALAQAAGREEGGQRIAAIFGLAGAINLPIIHFSVLWWRTLHQGESIGLTGSTIDDRILWPIPISVMGFSLIFLSVVLMRMRTLLADAKVEARLRRMTNI